MGESGSGKTSILKIIAGLMRPDGGFISYHDHIWYDDKSKVFVKPQLRKVGFVFQDYALFPSMTVEQNLSYANGSPSEKGLLNEILELMDLKSLVKSRPQQLSGGQQQRVALARAILRKPEIVLLDEPLSALDRKLRKKLQNDLESLHRHYGFTTLMVTHDESEVTRLADKVFILEEGQILRQGSPLEILNPAISLEKMEGEILSINKDCEELVISQPKGIFKLKISSDKLEGLSIGQHIKLTSKDWSINE
jgi:molybdate transport system ATP-binding protein